MTLPSSYRKANDHVDGPFRAVTGTEWAHYPGSNHWALRETLVCGHSGKVLYANPWNQPEPAPADKLRIEGTHNYLVRTKRRCHSCRTPEPASGPDAPVTSD